MKKPSYRLRPAGLRRRGLHRVLCETLVARFRAVASGTNERDALFGGDMFVRDFARGQLSRAMAHHRLALARILYDRAARDTRAPHEPRKRPFIGFTHEEEDWVIEQFYEGAPVGMTHEEFEIGREFMCGGRRWLCTDKGTRVVIAILAGTDEDGGPPYAVVEHTFDEYDIGGCDPVPEP